MQASVHGSQGSLVGVTEARYEGLAASALLNSTLGIEDHPVTHEVGALRLPAILVSAKSAVHRDGSVALAPEANFAWFSEKKPRSAKRSGQGVRRDCWVYSAGLRCTTDVAGPST